MARKGKPDPTLRSIQAAILTWILPGAGHYWLGHRGLAAVFFVAITFPYLAGVAIGGVKTSVNPHVNYWLFLAEMGTGGYTTTFYLINQRVGEIDPRALADSRQAEQIPPEVLTRYVSSYPESDVAQIYLAVAGLLNLLAILDASARARTEGRPVFHHELAAAAGAESGRST